MGLAVVIHNTNHGEHCGEEHKALGQVGQHYFTDDTTTQGYLGVCTPNTVGTVLFARAW